jgi:hypothetical protein
MSANEAGKVERRDREAADLFGSALLEEALKRLAIKNPTSKHENQWRLFPSSIFSFLLLNALRYLSLFCCILKSFKIRRNKNTI